MEQESDIIAFHTDDRVIPPWFGLWGSRHTKLLSVYLQTGQLTDWTTSGPEECWQWSSVARKSVFGQRSFPVLHPIYGWQLRKDSYQYCTMRNFCWISNNRSGVVSVST